MDPDVLLTAELRPATMSARRRAARDGDRQIDTAHLLHSLLETDAMVRASFSPAQLARLLGYLVQRSIGFGLQWQSSVEAAVEREGQPMPGQEQQAPGVVPPRAPEGDPSGGRQVRWSPAAAAALRRAAGRARSRGQARADGLDLLAALAADAESRAVEVLRFAGVDVARTLAALPHRA